MPLRTPTSAEFATMFRGWNRLEARSRSDDFSFGLAAATADPLWMLGRQWQLRELRAEDAGTPIDIALTYEEAVLDRIKLGDEQFEDIGATPVEVLVEREAVEWDWRLRIRAGQQFERLARLHAPNTADALIEQLRITHCRVSPLPDEWLVMDLATQRFVSLMADRAIDGKVLLDKLKAGQLDELIRSETLRTETIRWYEKLYSQPSGRASPAWNSEELHFDFRIRSTHGRVPGPLHASSYRRGTLDWDAFALEGSTSGKLTFRQTLHPTPTHALYDGQPTRRWWEFEDAAVRFGDLDVAKTDLAKLVLIEFALVHGDDWFIVPLTAKPNSLLRVSALLVRDCFGQETKIVPAREATEDPLKQWQVFALAPQSRGGQSADFLYVPPLAGTREESPVIEEVRFARDEDANIVFAIEEKVPNQLGEPVSGLAAHFEARRRVREDQHEAAPASQPVADSSTPASETEAAAPAASLKYVLATTVPRNWIPFVATTDGNVVAGLPQGAVRLRRAAIVSTEAEDSQVPISALSRLLKRNDGGGLDWIREEAVGRQGVRVELRRQRMRSATGETYVWLGRRVAVGKGEARSGLRFDVVAEARDLS